MKLQQEQTEARSRQQETSQRKAYFRRQPHCFASIALPAFPRFSAPQICHDKQQQRQQQLKPRLRARIADSISGYTPPPNFPTQMSGWWGQQTKPMETFIHPEAVEPSTQLR